MAVPLALRWAYYYEGEYEPEEVVRPDLAEIAAPTPDLESFADRHTAVSPGVIVVDRAHANRFEMAELSVLQARLSARGQRLETVETVEDLNEQLSYAKALIVISPGGDWASSEIEQVVRFVDKGGRLLLVTDPTRYGIEFDEWDLPVLDDDVPHINDLAARFGLLFQADYMYNTTDNAGNFRNIKLSNFADHDLTKGLDQVVFYAAHSLTSEEPALIITDGETRSSSSERIEELTAAVLAAADAVLALGDLTFMTEPYNTASDNARFVANIADFLSGARRSYDLADFPHFFADVADLVYADDPVLDSDLLQGGSTLQAFFADEGKELTVREAEDKTVDTLFFGLYEGAEDVESYLAAAQVTLKITPTEKILAEPESGLAPTPLPETTPAATPTLTTTVPTPPIRATPVPAAMPTITRTAPYTPTAGNRIEIESFGEMVVTGTALLLLQTDGDRQILVALADTEMGVGSAVDRLIAGDLESCLFRETALPTSILALCPTGEVAPGDGEGGWEEPEPEPDLPTSEPPDTGTTEPVEPEGEPEGESEASIVVVAMDHGEGRYDGMTSVDDYEMILGDRYDVTTWSTYLEGLPAGEDLLGYDVVIWSTGDYDGVLGDQESDTLFFVMLEGIPVILSGAFIGDTDIEAVQRDIQVHDATHPLVEGFEAEEVIGFVTAPSGSEYQTSVLEDLVEENGTVVPFVRGPESEEAGAPSVAIMEDDLTTVQVVFISFPIYLLPEEAKSRLVLNTVGYLLGP
jgi:hypothetical protein